MSVKNRNARSGLAHPRLPHILKLNFCTGFWWITKSGEGEEEEEEEETRGVQRGAGGEARSYGCKRVIKRTTISVRSAGDTVKVEVEEMSDLS